MRILSRVALVVFLCSLCSSAFAALDLTAECKLSLVGTNPSTDAFSASPHGVFRNGSLVYALRGQRLTTYNVTDLGDLQVAREGGDFIGSLAARDTNGGVAYSGGKLYISSAAGLEIYDISNVRSGGNPPVLVSRSRDFNYRRLTVSGDGKILAGIYPISEIPCAPLTTGCTNNIDIFNVANAANPVRVGSINAIDPFTMGGFNDIAFIGQALVATGLNGTVAYDITNPGAPALITTLPVSGSFLSVSPQGTELAIGQANVIGLFFVRSLGGGAYSLSNFVNYTLPNLTIDRSNPIMFHPQVSIDDAAGRLITMIDELDRDKLAPARTIAFDVFDFNVPMFTGSDPRLWETVTYTQPDEIKYNPLAVGAYVYVLGDQAGLQTWGACGNMTGKIEFDSLQQLICGASELHGWITGSQRIVSVEVFLDNTSLGNATLINLPRTDIPSRTPVNTWRIQPTNLDNTPAGDHLLKVVGTDANGNRRQVASQNIHFNGPGQNCAARRRSSGKQ
jgi:hypothetical protein